MPLYCGHCGKKLKGSTRNEKIYMCGTGEMIPFMPCGQIQVLRDRMQEILVKAINAQAKVFLNELKRSRVTSRDIHRMEKQKQALEKEKQGYRDQRIKLYEKFKAGMLEQDDFLRKKREVLKLEEECLNEYETLCNEITEKQKQLEKLQIGEDKYKEYALLKSYDYDVVHHLISKVECFNDGHIKIHWNFKAEFRVTIIRKLKALSPPVEVYFEKENLSSLDDKTDMVLAMMASIAQEESRSISANISWAIRKRMENGTQKIPTACLLGYASDEDGNMVIVEDEAKVVRFIYKNFILGMHPSVIAQKLNKQGSTTVLGNPWSALSVRNILENEKYCGDVLMQKTFTDSYLTHKVKKNNGERQQFFIADHHDAIVSHEVWNRAKELLDKMYYKNWKRQAQQRLIPLAAGILMGYIPIDPKWKEVSIARLENATNKVMAGAGGQVVELVQESKEEEREDMEMPDILEGFEVVDIEVGKSDSVLTIMGNMLKFNKPTATELGYPAFVRTLINVPEKKVAIQVCTEKTKNATPFSKPEAKQSYAITIKNPAIVVAVHKLLPDLSPDDSLTFKGTLYAEEKVIIYDLTKGEPIKRRKRRKPTAESAAGDATATDAEEMKEQAAGDSADQN